ncbi:MAG TPA: hypothetical protein VEB66_18005 [Opitutaceae bacterium]|nr:hypothetical protein [Opitutaceae bacterium]
MLSTNVRELSARGQEQKGRTRKRHTPPSAHLLNGPGGDVLSPDLVRKLCWKDWTVWRYLVDLRGYSQRDLHVALERVLVSLKLKERTLDHCLRRLEAAGLIERHRSLHVSSVYQVYGEVRDGERAPQGRRRWTSTLTVRVYGAVDTVCGEEVIWAPSATIVFLTGKRRPGRPARTMRTGNCGAESLIVAPRPAPKAETMSIDSAELPGNCGAPEISISGEVVLSGSPSENRENAAAAAAEASPSRMEPSEHPASGPQDQDGSPRWVALMLAAADAAFRDRWGAQADAASRMLRQQEATGRLSATADLTYQDLRAAERAAGYHDPLARMPGKASSRSTTARNAPAG